jgi:type II secretory pathway pseudopilin PulG
MVASKRSGTTLVELMVVMGMFSMLTGVLLYFFAFASRATRSHENLSQKQREMLRVLDRIEVLLADSTVLYFSGNNQVVFTKLNVASPILPGGWPNFQSKARTIVARSSEPNGTKLNQLYLVENGKESQIAALGDDSVSFFLQQNPVGGLSTQVYYIGPFFVTYNGTYKPKEGIGVTKNFTYSRAIRITDSLI